MTNSCLNSKINHHKLSDTDVFLLVKYFALFPYLLHVLKKTPTNIIFFVTRGKYSDTNKN